MRVQSIYEVSEEFTLPEITKEKVAKLAKQIKPMVRKDDTLYFIEDMSIDNMYKQSFTFDPKYTEPTKGLVQIDSIFFLSTGYPAMWKPTLSEVYRFVQQHPDVDAISAIEVEYISAHQSGEGSIGKVNLYIKEDTEKEDKETKEVEIEELYFFESSKESIVSYLGNIGQMSDGGYLIKEGTYKIRTSLEKLLEMSNNHEVSIKIFKGKIYISH